MTKSKRLSIIIPVFFNSENLYHLYSEIQEEVINRIPAETEIIFIDDGSEDDSWDILTSIAAEHIEVQAIRLSRNFGSHAAILCGLSHASGDCAVIKAADSQEPCEIIPQMFAEWEKGNNVVLAVREGRDDSAGTTAFADFYYWFVSKIALPSMPQRGFDIYLIDRKVINVLELMDEANSALTAQILWSGFKTATVNYHRLARTSGKSRWTFHKKVKLFSDTVFSFTSLPIRLITILGFLSTIGAIIWAIVALAARLSGMIIIQGWTTSFIFNLFSFGVIMLTLGLLGGYLWRTFEASRNRPIYIVEDEVSRPDTTIKQSEEV